MCLKLFPATEKNSRDTNLINTGLAAVASTCLSTALNRDITRRVSVPLCFRENLGVTPKNKRKVLADLTLARFH